MCDQDTANIVDFFSRILSSVLDLNQLQKETVFRTCVDVSCSSFDYIVALGLIIYQYIE